jgi:protein-S-isoprenylcysteine O-methyltransferase Ste14
VIDKRTLQRIRVPLGFLFAVLFIVFARPTTATLIMGSLIVVIGLLIRTWSAGHIRKAQQLAVTGPYAYTRNPLYLGSFIMGAGFTVAAGVWWLALLFCALFIGIYLPVMRVEAEDMKHIFAADFEEYERNVPLFFPRPTAWRRMGGKFDLGLYLRYREYNAAIGAALAMAVLAAKFYFLDRS